jgi:hypothetical protein
VKLPAPLALRPTHTAITSRVSQLTHFTRHISRLRETVYVRDIARVTAAKHRADTLLVTIHPRIGDHKEP